MLKRYHISLLLPDLPAAYAEQVATAEGSDLRIAVNKGLAEMLRRPQVSGRRIKSATIRIQCVDSKSNERN